MDLTLSRLTYKHTPGFYSCQFDLYLSSMADEDPWSCDYSESLEDPYCYCGALEAWDALEAWNALEA